MKRRNFLQKASLSTIGVVASAYVVACNTDNIKIETIDFSKSTKARYIKVLAKNYGDVPKWHLGAPFNGKAWIFVDEIQIK